MVSAGVHQLHASTVPQQWFLLAALTLVSGSATVNLRSSHASISISEVFVFIAILLYGPAAGTVIVALDGLVISFWLAKRHRGTLPCVLQHVCTGDLRVVRGSPVLRWHLA